MIFQSVMASSPNHLQGIIQTLNRDHDDHLNTKIVLDSYDVDLISSYHSLQILEDLESKW